MNRLYRLLLVLALLLVISSAIPVALHHSEPAAASGGPVVSDVPDQPISRKLFNDGTLAENLIAAGQWIDANDLCTVYGVDADPGATQAVEVFYLRQCYEWVEEVTP